MVRVPVAPHPPAESAPIRPKSATCGGAMTGPAWQALLPEMVKKRQLPMAMSLGGASWNLSRIVGPLLGGPIGGLLYERVIRPLLPGKLPRTASPASA